MFEKVQVYALRNVCYYFSLFFSSVLVCALRKVFTTKVVLLQRNRNNLKHHSNENNE